MLVRSAAAAAALALVPLASAAPVQAAESGSSAGSCGISVPSKVSVYSPYRSITATFSSGCVINGALSAWWEIVHPTQGYQGAFHYDGTSMTDVQDWYDFSPLGTYKIRPELAYDDNYDDMIQNTRYMTVKLGSRMSASSSRSGNYVYVSGGAARYSPSAGTFRAWPYTKVVLRKKSCSSCSWSYVKSGTTNRYGKVRLSTYSSGTRYWQIATVDSSNTWGRASATMKR